MRFSPLLLSSLIVKPLRYFFANHTAAQGLVWSEDLLKSTIEIGAINDFHGIKLGAKPRILVNRGPYAVTKSGLTDSMAEAGGVYALKGKNDRINTKWIKGAPQIIIESRQEGLCELLADMVSHFIVWSSPLLCDTQGFHYFGAEMQVSECTPDKEDVEKFKCMITFNYEMEEQWNVKWDSAKFKTMFLSITPSNPSIPGPSIPSPVGAPVIDTTDLVGAVQVILN